VIGPALTLDNILIILARRVGHLITPNFSPRSYRGHPFAYVVKFIITTYYDFDNTREMRFCDLIKFIHVKTPCSLPAARSYRDYRL
jgi:hypothetical protein